MNTIEPSRRGRDLVAATLLDRNFSDAVAELWVKSARRQRGVERDPVLLGEYRLHVRAYLVGDVSRDRGAVAADDDHVDHPVLHQVTCRVVGDERERHPCLLELPSGESGALITRPGL